MNIERYIKRKQAQKLKDKTVAKRFMWRDRRGQYHDPDDMQTHHLFYTIRMIWNHSMPFKLLPYNRYTFSETYTADYMEKALRAMVPELAKRSDIANAHRAALKTMTRWLSTVQIEERKKAAEKTKNSDYALLVFK